jgi:hypothetical protein
MLIDFNEDIDEIKNKILEIKNNTLKKTEKVDIDIVLRQQKNCLNIMMKVSKNV